MQFDARLSVGLLFFFYLPTAVNTVGVCEVRITESLTRVRMNELKLSRSAADWTVDTVRPAAFPLQEVS